jgi:hypothetical protein
MKAVLISSSVLLLLGVAGCAGRERVYENIYHGLNAREELVNPSTERGVQKDRLPTYQEYEAERKRMNESSSK